MEYIVHEFYYHPDGDGDGDQTVAHDKFMECILVFDTGDEKEKFKEFVLLNWESKEKYSKDIQMPYFEEIKGYNMDVIRDKYAISQILQNMLNVFRIVK